MNKKLLAVALATAFAAPAMADGVQIYGAFDVGVLARGGSDGAINSVNRGSGTETQVASGMNGHNGIGFRMSEDLGNGMKISGDAMFGFALDSAGNTGDPSGTGGGFSTIYSYLALSGDFGTLVAGRAGGARAGWLKKYDPFGGFGVGGQLAVHNSALGNADYADNVIAWITPEVLPGLKGLFAYTSNLVGQDRTVGSAQIDPDGFLTGTPGGRNAGSTPLYAIAAMYDSGPLSFVANYEKLWLYNSQDTHVVTFGGSYDFGVAKLFAAYDQLTNATNGWQIGASAPVSEALTLKAGYARSEVRGGGPFQDAECGKISVGGVYTMSKRTNLYADYARLTNLDPGSNCASGITTYAGSFSNAGSGRDNGAGYGEWGMNVGVRHSF